jgi:CBS domain-containing protein
VDNKTDVEHSHVIGIITERDIVKTIAHHMHEIEDKKVEEIMSNKLISTTPETTTDDAIKLMVENQIRHLAVMDKEKLVGVISMRDIFYSINYLSNN